MINSITRYIIYHTRHKQPIWVAHRDYWLNKYPRLSRHYYKNVTYFQDKQDAECALMNIPKWIRANLVIRMVTINFEISSK